MTLAPLMYDLAVPLPDASEKLNAHAMWIQVPLKRLSVMLMPVEILVFLL